MPKSRRLGLNSGFDICKLYKRTCKLPKALPLAEPQFPELKRTPDGTCPTGLWGASTNEKMNAKC